VGPRLVVTPGDPRGIGPEVTAEAVRLFEEEVPGASLSVVGPTGLLPLAEVESLRHAFSHTTADDPKLFGADVAAGAFAGGAILRAVEMTVAGSASAIVTAPLHKPSLHAAGWIYPGQTEFLADLAGVPDVGMLMAAERTRLEAPLRVLLATTHLPLSAVPGAVTSDLLTRQIRLLQKALVQDWGITTPRIGLCALNPHASDGGLFGSEEAEIFVPAVDAARASGIDVSGPLPADTVFSRALAGAFDAVVAPYHDVGMAAFKTVSFGTGVNVSIGLPFVRTSPDHGTAFDIAGSGTADSSSMLEALRLAWQLAKTRFDTPSVVV
jgi:4-hydroxythreonine-4-phosphate dehydrogenase